MKSIMISYGLTFLMATSFVVSCGKDSSKGGATTPVATVPVYGVDSSAIGTTDAEIQALWTEMKNKIAAIPDGNPMTLNSQQYTKVVKSISNQNSSQGTKSINVLGLFNLNVNYSFGSTNSNNALYDIICTQINSATSLAVRSVKGVSYNGYGALPACTSAFETYVATTHNPDLIKVLNLNAGTWAVRSMKRSANGTTYAVVVGSTDSASQYYQTEALFVIDTSLPSVANPVHIQDYRNSKLTNVNLGL